VLGGSSGSGSSGSGSSGSSGGGGWLSRSGRVGAEHTVPILGFNNTHRLDLAKDLALGSTDSTGSTGSG
jgi:hypothetical protein